MTTNRQPREGHERWQGYANNGCKNDKEVNIQSIASLTCAVGKLFCRGYGQI